MLPISEQQLVENYYINTHNNTSSSEPSTTPTATKLSYTIFSKKKKWCHKEIDDGFKEFCTWKLHLLMHRYLGDSGVQLVGL
jgi:hypothetical protein